MSNNEQNIDLLEQLKIQHAMRQQFKQQQQGINPSGVPLQDPNQVFQIKEKQKTKYEVSKDSVFYIRYGIAFVEGRIVITNEKEALVDKTVEKHWVKFRMWNFGEEINWKNQATEYDSMKRVHTLNMDKYNDLKIRNLMLEWSFEEYNQEMKLLHVNGVLSDESFNLFFRMFPSLIRFVINKMNGVLEYNE